MDKDRRLLGKLIECMQVYKEHNVHTTGLTELGQKMADMKNSTGYPPDRFMERLTSLSSQEKLFVSHIYCVEMINHKRMSGAPEKAIQRTRKHNRQILNRLIDTGELGAY